MKIIKLSQQDDREAWLDERRGRITGTKVKIVKPLTRGADRTPQGFWTLIAEKLAIESDGEKDIDRGQRLENEALELFAKNYKLKINLNPGMWVHNDYDEIAYSPDGAEDVKIPKWTAEAKCLSSPNHLKYVIRHKRADKLSPDYKAIDYIPNDSKCNFKEQVIQSFVVNESQVKLYFVLYDDRIILEDYILHVIEIDRIDIEEEILEQKVMQIQVLEDIHKMLKEIKA